MEDQKDSALKVTEALLPGAGAEPATSDFCDSHPSPGGADAEAALLLRGSKVGGVPSPRLDQEDPLSSGCLVPLRPGLGAVIYIARSLEEGLGASSWAGPGLPRSTRQRRACPGVRKPPSRASLLKSWPAPLVWHRFLVIPGGHIEQPHLTSPHALCLFHSSAEEPQPGREQGLTPLNKRDPVAKSRSELSHKRLECRTHIPVLSLLGVQLPFLLLQL